MSPPIWLITGASSGFGRSVAELVLNAGGIVVATLRKPEALVDLQAKYPSSQLLVLQLDVTKPDEIAAAFSSAKDAFGRVDVVFNNAGYSVLAEVEGTPDDAARAMFEVNFWGAANVSKEAVRFFREVNAPAGGRLIISSSIVGVVPAPSMGYYTATKHALEGLSKAFAAELDPKWNIKMTLVEYAGFATNGTNNIVRTPPHPAYTDPSLASAQIRAFITVPNGAHMPGDPRKAAQKVYELAQLDNPPQALVLGQRALVEIRKVVKGMSEELDLYEGWSEDLNRNV